MKKLVNGVEVDMTPEEIAEREAEEAAWLIEQAMPKLRSPSLWAIAQLTIADSDIQFAADGKIAGAWYESTGRYWVFFAEALPDANYLALAYDGAECRAYVRSDEKFPEMCIVSVVDMTGTPADAESLSLEIKCAL